MIVWYQPASLSRHGAWTILLHFQQPTTMTEKDNGAAAPVITKTVTPEHIENHDSGILLYDDDGHVRRLPVPSSSPNDPLNFGPWRQRLILLAVCLYGVTGFGVIQVTPLFFGKLIPVYKAQTQGVSLVVGLTCKAKLTHACSNSMRRASLTWQAIRLCAWAWATSYLSRSLWHLGVVFHSFSAMRSCLGPLSGLRARTRSSLTLALAASRA